MHDAYLDYLRKFSSRLLTGEEKDLIRKSFIPARLKRKQYILQAGDICKKFAFIVKGAMRMYIVDYKGIEHILRLGIEDWWMGDRESWINTTPSRYYIDALERCDLLYLSLDNARQLETQIPAFRQMMRMLHQRNNMANERRLTSAISYTAEKRYTELMECCPHLAARFPQHVLAAYLGIDKNTLSRVKRRYNLK